VKTILHKQKLPKENNFFATKKNGYPSLQKQEGLPENAHYKVISVLSVFVRREMNTK